MGWTVADIPDQSGRLAVITGANRGIGFETAKALAGSGAAVVLGCRSGSRGADARAAIRSTHPDAEVRVAELDLADLDGIATFADRLGDGPPIDVLVNNAGVMAVSRGETADGFERQFGVNHLGHFALTGRLLDRLAETARVVTVSSGMHRSGTIDFSDLNSEDTYDPWAAYADSKLANVLFAYELDRRLEADGRDVLSLCAHPGWADTRLQVRSAGDSRIWRFAMRALNKVFAQSAAQGALPVLYAATAPGVRRRGFYGPRWLFNSRGAPTAQQSSKASYDRETARRLWSVSAELTGLAFDLPPADTGGDAAGSPDGLDR